MPICDGFEACEKIISIMNNELIFDSLNENDVMSSENVKEKKLNKK